jgi:uncharacterized protein (DUF305 family)
MRLRKIAPGLLTLLLASLILAGCGAQPSATSPSSAPGGEAAAGMPTAMPSSMAGMDHGTMPGTGAADAPYDAQFIDSMIAHHQGAIDMAEQVLAEPEARQELKTLAENIITAQEAEIEQMRQWREAWFPDLPETQGLGMEMGDMMISDDTSIPFDQRFTQAMIAHHEGAIVMARDAQQKAERSEIRTLADNIITAQEGEIAQMRQWLNDWYGISQ